MSQYTATFQGIYPSTIASNIDAHIELGSRAVLMSSHYNSASGVHVAVVVFEIDPTCPRGLRDRARHQANSNDDEFPSHQNMTGGIL